MRHTRSTRHLAWLLPAGLCIIVLALRMASTLNVRQDDAPPVPSNILAAAPAIGGPWLYGSPAARLTVILYADLECEHCEAYFPVVRAWVDDNPDVRLQWHHLPLAAHEPAASALASFAECNGEAGGTSAFWDTVAWIYEHSRGGGQGLPSGVSPPGGGPEQKACLDSGRPQSVIRAQAESGASEGITATPTIRLRDEASGRSLLLPGPIEGDALLSAVDLLSTPELPAESQSPE